VYRIWYIVFDILFFFSSGKRASILTGNCQYIYRIDIVIYIARYISHINNNKNINNNNMGLIFFFYFCTPQIDAASIEFPAARRRYYMLFIIFVFISIYHRKSHIFRTPYAKQVIVLNKNIILVRTYRFKFWYML